MSVCIPTYNGARFLQAALDSASSQTFADIEILCVDDGSSDETPAIVKAHQARDPRTVLVQNERNLGLVGNWNRCLELAKGEWIKFLFQDDTLASECVERMIAATAEGDRFVVCAREYVFEMPEEEIDLFYRNVPKITEMTTKRRLMPEESAELLSRNLNLNVVGEPICTLFHADVPREFGPFDPRLRQLCDHEYWVRVMGNLGVALIDEQLARFTVHASSTSAKNARSGVDVSAVDLVIIMERIAHDARFRRIRAALGRRFPRLFYATLFLLSRGRAQQTDKTFAEFVAANPWVARRYRLLGSGSITKLLSAVLRWRGH